MDGRYLRRFLKSRAQNRPQVQRPLRHAPSRSELTVRAPDPVPPAQPLLRPFPFSLREAYLGSNNFTSVPSGSFKGLTSLFTLSLADNVNLSPWPFPSELTDSSSTLVTLSLDHTGLAGSLPDFFANFTHLTNLTLSFNDLTGPIPKTLSHLTYVDLSGNNLSGDIPTFPTTLTLTIAPGNALLTNPTPPDGSSNSPTSTISPALIAAIVIAVLVLVAFVFYKCYMHKRPVMYDTVDGAIEMGPNPQDSTTSMPIQYLQHITDNFSDHNIVGRGGFGVVFKGELDNGTIVAVKKMDSTAMGNKAAGAFQAEIAVLAKVKHRHIVSLLGYCVNGNDRLLVYEYMPQGTLSQHLFGSREDGHPPLTWKQRVSIALDVARGVEYLHNLAQQSFIHRDLKSSNILLDDHMRAKVADFGLVKNALGPDGNDSLQATHCIGTYGYLAPEYASAGKLTTKLDVYAFGVVLMEIITGRKVLEIVVLDDYLVPWFRSVLINEESIPKVIDQTLATDDYRENIKSIYEVCKLAGHCTAWCPSERPKMGHAVSILSPIVEQWNPTPREDEEGSGNNPFMSLPDEMKKWQAGEGTSTMFGDSSYSQTQSSIPSTSSPNFLQDTMRSMDG